MTINSYAKYLSGLYEAMLVDIACKTPALRIDCERDSKRLLSIIEREGIRVLLVDLPAQAKHLDKCLASGCLTPSGVAHMGSFRRRGIIPKLFKGLYLRIFDENGCLKSSPDKQAIWHLRLLLLAAKKFRLPCSDSSTWSTVDEFFRTDRECPSPTLSWDGDDISTSDVRDLCFTDRVITVLSGDDLFPETVPSPLSNREHGLLACVQLAADIVSATLGRFDPLEWKAKHGPGSVSDLRIGSYKYDFPFWPDKLERFFPYSSFAFANEGMWLDHIQSHGIDGDNSYRHEPPSRLIAVPKTLLTPRLIASEPVAHQWCQQTIRDFMASRVSKTPLARCVDFSSQDANGALALEASRDMSHATIDLSSASDRMSCWVVERFFRANSSMIEALHACRTRYVSNDIDRKSPRFHKLRKFSTQGSAVTFPLQTYVFATVAIGSTLYQRGLSVTLANMRLVSKEVRIFGDDIIVPIDAASITQEALGYLGFKVNADKTFETGKFRESCGVEAYDGTDVSRISVLTSPDVVRPESIMSSVDVHNNFFVRGFMHCAEFIQSTVDGIRGIRVPFKAVGSGAFGFNSYLDIGTSRTRFNDATQKRECFCTRLLAKVERKQVERGSMMLQYFTEACIPPTRLENRLGVSSRSATKLRGGWVPVEKIGRAHV